MLACLYGSVLSSQPTRRLGLASIRWHGECRAFCPTDYPAFGQHLPRAGWLADWPLLFSLGKDARHLAQPLDFERLIGFVLSDRSAIYPQYGRMIQLAAGFILASLVAWIAYSFHSLSRDGAVAAALVGTLILVWADGNGRCSYLHSLSHPLRSRASSKNASAGLMKSFQKAVNVTRVRYWETAGWQLLLFAQRGLPESALDLGRLCRRPGFRQCRYLGNRTWHVKPTSAAYDHGFTETRRSRDFGRGVVMGNDRGPFRRVYYRLVCCGSLFKN